MYLIIDDIGCVLTQDLIKEDYENADEGLIDLIKIDEGQFIEYFEGDWNKIYERRSK